MAKGLLGKILTVAGQFMQGYRIGSTAEVATVTIDLENLNSGAGEDATCEIYFSASTTPDPLDRVARAVVPTNGGHFELSCKLASAGEYILVKSDKDNVAVRVTGIENIPTV